jgi:hypothetical protein
MFPLRLGCESVPWIGRLVADIVSVSIEIVFAFLWIKGRFLDLRLPIGIGHRRLVSILAGISHAGTFLSCEPFRGQFSGEASENTHRSCSSVAAHNGLVCRSRGCTGFARAFGVTIGQLVGQWLFAALWGTARFRRTGSLIGLIVYEVTVIALWNASSAGIADGGHVRIVGHGGTPLPSNSGMRAIVP